MRSLILGFLSLLTLAVAAGCSQESAGETNYVAPSKADVDKQIAAIDADPNLPPQAKAMKKAMLQKNGTGQTGTK